MILDPASTQKGKKSMQAAVLLKQGSSPTSQMNKISSMVNLTNLDGDVDVKGVDEDDMGQRAHSEAIKKESSETDMVTTGERNVVYLDDDDSDGFEIL